VSGAGLWALPPQGFPKVHKTGREGRRTEREIAQSYSRQGSASLVLEVDHITLAAAGGPNGANARGAARENVVCGE